MFVYSIRASGVKLFAVIFLTLLLLAGILLSGGSVFASSESVGEVSFSDIETEEDRIAFLKTFGIEVKDEAVEEVDFVMPEDFDRVMLGYNEIQRTQGLDLSKYSKKRITRYTYSVTNYDGYDGEVYANLLIYRGRIIGCDISSADPEGFVEPIVKK